MLKLFYQKRCPYCKQALQYLDELKSEYPEVKLEMIEETEQPDLANQYDYYYVPTFYLDQVKLHEGPVTKEDVSQILEKAK